MQVCMSKNGVYKCKKKGANHHIQKWDTSWQERVSTSKNGRIQHKKGLAYPKTGQNETEWSLCIQKWDNSGPEGVGTYKNEAEGIYASKGTHHDMKHVQKQGKSAGRGRCIPKRDKFEARQGQHMHKRDNTEPEGVSTSKKGMIWGQKGLCIQKVDT